MKLINTARNYVAPTKYQGDELEPIIKHIAENATESTPYSSLNILDEVLKMSGPLGIDDKDALIAVSHVMQELVQRHRWYTVSGYFFVAYGPKETMLRSVIYGALGAGVDMNVQSIAETVQACTGEYPESDTLRKNLQRLVNNGKFTRTDKGVYRREVKGI